MTHTATGTIAGGEGVKIAYWRSGDASGRPIVLVHGTTSSHRTYDELVPHVSALRPTVTYDRRGRGESGESPSVEYSIELEGQDAAAVIDTIAREAGEPVDVIGHSYGAFVALSALAHTDQVRALVAYSPGFGASYPPGTLENVESAIADDDTDEALQVIFREIIGMEQPDIDVLRDSPVWEVRRELAWSVPRECREDAAFVEGHVFQLQAIDIPVAILSGENNTEQKRQIATRLGELIPTSVVTELAGEGHAAHHTAPAALTAAAIAFFDGLPQQ